MLNFLTGLVGPVSNIATTFLKNKAAVSQAKHEAKMSVIQNDANWEAHMAQASASSLERRILDFGIKRTHFYGWVEYCNG